MVDAAEYKAGLVRGHRALPERVDVALRLTEIVAAGPVEQFGLAPLGRARVRRSRLRVGEQLGRSGATTAVNLAAAQTGGTEARGQMGSDARSRRRGSPPP